MGTQRQGVQNHFTGRLPQKLFRVQLPCRRRNLCLAGMIAPLNAAQRHGVPNPTAAAVVHNVGSILVVLSSASLAIFPEE